MTVKACKFIVLCTKRLFEDCIIIRETSGHVILVFLNMTGVSLLVVCSQLAHSKSWALETFGVGGRAKSERNVRRPPHVCLAGAKPVFKSISLEVDSLWSA